MAFEFYMPDIGEGVVEGEVVKWKVKEGDAVALDQPIVEVMTDKATVELPSPRAGRIAKINYKEGEICPVGKVLVVIEESGAAASPGNGKKPPAQIVDEPPRARPSTQQVMHSKVAENVHGGGGAIEVVDATQDRSRVLATPATRRLARQLGVEIGRVPATGKHGRVTSDDVRNFRQAPTAAPAAKHAPIAIAKGGDEERIPLRGVRKRIAESMARSVHTAAHFTYVEEIDMTELVTVRDHAKARAAERGLKLNYLPFIVKAVVSSLKKWPQLNASLDETTQEIVRKRYYHIGIAAQGPQGLAVSVVRDADRRSIFDLSKEIDRLGEAVRAGTATRDELTGSTFTISSLGKLGGVLATPIINFPEVAILGVHKIEERPAVRDGQIVARHLMNLSISVDHRLADGWDGAMFLQDVKALLEDPTTMFMEMV
ncbi:MAG TPA: dihydrolipoamide acetyltransferase family protein [Kofleriaceae bacterium]|nr:dihydrolipoamide acetyltransferase family protein [Kofleriaceae bacterium]